MLRLIVMDIRNMISREMCALAAGLIAVCIVVFVTFSYEIKKKKKHEPSELNLNFLLI